MFGRLLILFILVPIVELYLFLTLGEAIGLRPTLAIIIVTAVAGASLTKSQGRRALGQLQRAVAEGRLPHQEATEGILILIAGAFLLTPGFLTDALGFSLLMPPVRALIRQQLALRLKEKIQVVPVGMSPDDSTAPTPQPGSKLDNGEVIDV